MRLVALLLMLVSISMFTVGCAPADKPVPSDPEISGGGGGDEVAEEGAEIEEGAEAEEGSEMVEEGSETAEEGAAEESADPPAE